MKACLFPGQGSQFTGMGKELYESSENAKSILDRGNEQLGFEITRIMFNGPGEELKKTEITQPAIYLHSMAIAEAAGGRFDPSMVAGHSLGEFSALAASGALSIEDGLQLVNLRARAMQKACESTPSTMAAILGMEDKIIEQTCKEIDETVVPANFNSPGQVVISGTRAGVEKAVETLKEKGVKKAVILNVGGAFHSPVMEPAREELAIAIEKTPVSTPDCPVYQNVSAQPEKDPQQIKQNLIAQLTSPVKWTQTIRNMINDGADTFLEVGPGKVLSSLVKKINPKMEAQPFEL